MNIKENSQNSVIYIAVKEYFLLNEIWKSSKYDKTKYDYFTPIMNGCMNTRRGMTTFSDFVFFLIVELFSIL